MLTIEFNKPKIHRRWRTTTRQHHYPHDKPAYTGWYEKGQKHCEVYYLNNLTHRENDKPAYTEWYSNGQKSYESYCMRDHYHRENDKPAVTTWCRNGQKDYEAYHLNGIKYRIRKPTC